MLSFYSLPAECDSRASTHISALPQEVMVRLFRYLGPEDLCRCSQVCHTWAELVKTGSLWRHLYPVRWARGERPVTLFFSASSLHKMYREVQRSCILGQAPHLCNSDHVTSQGDGLSFKGSNKMRQACCSKNTINERVVRY